MLNKKVLSIVSAVILICFLAAFVFSYLSPYLVSAATTQDKISSKQSEKKEIQGKINDAKNEKKDAVAEKNGIEQRINTLNGEINKCNVKIADAEAKITDCEIKAEKQYDNMKTRMRVMYEDNSTSYITMIFGGDNINDILSYIELIKQVLNHDNNMYEEILDTKKEIENLKAQVVDEKKVLDGKKSELDKENQRLDSTINEINGDIEKLQEMYDQAEKAEKALKAQLASELAKSTTTASYSGGKFAWPAPGYSTVTSPYGYRLHPTLKVYKGHTGMDIGAPYGATVVAAEAGTVVKAQYHVAYGNYIVINHGNGYSTLYGHNSALLVSAGQTVSRGQAIAKVGSTGYSTGPHCHFEVMINGSTTDPAPYLR